MKAKLAVIRWFADEAFRFACRQASSECGSAAAQGNRRRSQYFSPNDEHVAARCWCGAGRFTLSQQANITDNSGTLHCPGKATTVDTARWFIHGTDVQEALRVLYDRSMSSRIDDGPAGEGVYGSTMLDDEDESILEGWTRVRRSGKCISAAFFFEADSLIVHSQEGWLMIAGSA